MAIRLLYKKHCGDRSLDAQREAKEREVTKKTFNEDFESKSLGQRG